MFGAGLRGRRGPPVLHGRAAQRRAAASCRPSPAAPRATARWTQDIWSLAPYTEADLQRQYRPASTTSTAPRASRSRRTSPTYVGGRQRLHRRGASSTRCRCPASTRRSASPQGPEPWNVARRDRHRHAGRRHLRQGRRRASSTRRWPTRRRASASARKHGQRGLARLPLAPRTPRRRSPCCSEALPLPGAARRRSRKGSVALPDPGSVQQDEASTVAASRRRARGRGSAGLLDGLLASPRAMSNALLVSGRESASGQPLAVFGPQTGYFAPQILMEVDLHGPASTPAAPPSRRQPLRELGRGRDYAWSATSASQDIIDTFAVDLCEPGGGKPTLAARRTTASAAAACRSRCSSARTAGSPAPADIDAGRHARRCAALRTKLGHGDRARHGQGQAGGLHQAALDLHARGRLRASASRASTTRTRSRNAARLPARRRQDRTTRSTGSTPTAATSPTSTRATTRCAPSGVNPNFPVRAQVRVARLQPRRLPRRYTPFSKHPQTINQSYIVELEQQAGARLPRPPTPTGSTRSIYRSLLLEDRVKRGIKGARKMTLPQLVDAMETAGVHRPARRRRCCPTCCARSASRRTRALRDGRRQAARLGRGRRACARTRTATASTTTPRRCGSWTPGGRCWCAAPSSRRSARTLYDRFIGFKNLDNEPNNHGAHLGSAYQGGTYGLVQKDLRTLLGRKRLQQAEAAPPRARRRATRAPTAAARSGAAARCAAAAACSRRTLIAGARRDARADLRRGRDLQEPARPRPVRPAPQGRRPVVLRLDLDARARRRPAAGDPLDQPPDLPAGRRDPGPCAALEPLAVAALALAPRAPRPPAHARVLGAETVLPPGAERLRVGRRRGRGHRLAAPQRPDRRCSRASASSPRCSTSPARPSSPAAGREDRARTATACPAITGASDYDAWWGVGYAVAQDRLFQLELFRRATSGRLAEILGDGYLDDDLIARRDYYTDAELDADDRRASRRRLRRRAEAYRDGINAWVAEVRSRPVASCPASSPRWRAARPPGRCATPRAIGVFLARTVPSGDGAELENARALKELGPRGVRQAAAAAHQGPRCPTVPARAGRVPLPAGPHAQAGAARLHALAALRRRPAACPAPQPPLAARQRESRRILPRGGSYMWAIGRRRRSYASRRASAAQRARKTSAAKGAGNAFLFNGPQLGFSIPELFVEFELHSPGAEHARRERRRRAGAWASATTGAWRGASPPGCRTRTTSTPSSSPAPRPTASRARRARWTAATSASTSARPPPTCPDLVHLARAGCAGSRTERICRTVHGPVQVRAERRGLRPPLRDLGPRAGDARRPERAQRRADRPRRRPGDAAA